MSNKFCTSCKQSFNALNGCFCMFLNRYVEYAKTPPWYLWVVLWILIVGEVYAPFLGVAVNTSPT